MPALVSCTVYDAKLAPGSSAHGVRGDAGVRSSNESRPGIVTQCGDGQISGSERCDTGIAPGKPGACPTECAALAPCAQRVLNGSACQAECLLLEPFCAGGDGCCPARCAPENDSDCSGHCGDGKVDRELGETCDRGASPACPQTVADCSDADPCTMDLLLGSAANCNAECTHVPVTAARAGDQCCPSGANANTDADCTPVCGNGVREATEDCDGTRNCSADCRASAPITAAARCLDAHGSDECERCSCSNCLADYAPCRDDADAGASEACSAIIDCTHRTGCASSTCFCGNQVPCSDMRGPCRTEIETAAHSSDFIVIAALTTDPGTAVGRAFAVDACRAAQCAALCNPSKE